MRRRMVAMMMMMMIACLALAGAAAAGPEDEILGRWLTEEGRSTVEIYRQGNDLRGKLVHLKEPLDENGQPKKDKDNPDESKRDRLLLGMDILWGFAYKGDSTWAGGRVYDPKEGKTYYCKLQIDKNGVLQLRGSLDRWGLLGRTSAWTRIPEKKEENGSVPQEAPAP